MVEHLLSECYNHKEEFRNEKIPDTLISVPDLVINNNFN